MDRMDKTGLRGVLYEDSCSMINTLPSPFFSNGSVENKVALIQQETCSLLDQLIKAQMDGAHACIVYASHIESPSFQIPESNINNSSITIPVFYVHKQIGQNLYKQLNDVFNHTEVSPKRVVRVLLLPPMGGTPNPWEVTLLILIIILAFGFMSSVCLHLYLWRRQKKLQRLIDSGQLPPTPDMLPMNKLLLTPVKLDLFPTRIIPEEDDKTCSSVISETDHTCVICLDTLDVGQKVRELPCLHEYHCDCIDPWLTSKSGECPLCKFNCVRHVTTPEEQKATDEAHAYYTNTDVNIIQVFKHYVLRRLGRLPPTPSQLP
ncbi:hypothetical protein BC941DRAFT_472977 [Chlamydoabsidia padenii]|nr:hypothetical protein BC941DRAFT_472977 [Chlamydoabsidia padenii]